jgi:hypothetical protein
MKIDRFTLSDTARQSDGEDVVIGTPVTALQDAMSGVTFRTQGVGANPQLPAVILSDTRNANDALAMEKMKGR